MLNNIIEFIKKHKALFCSLIISTVLAVISCFVIHKEEFDLTVYKQMIEIMKNLNTGDLFSYISHRGEIISMGYFYLMGKIGLENYIQVLPTFIFYLIIFYILIDYSQVKEYKKKNLLITMILFFALFKYMDIAACIRNSLAFSVFLLGLYLEIMKKRKKTAYILYLVSCLIHTSLWIIIILKEFARIKNQKIFIGILITILLVIAFPQGVIYLFNITNIEILTIISERIEMYILNAKMYPNIQYLFRIMQLISLTVFSIYSLYKHQDKEVLFRNFSITIFIITLFLINKYWIFQRFVNFSMFISLIPIMTLLEKMPNNIFKKIVYLGIVLMVVVGIRIQIPTYTLMFIK